MGNRTAVKHLYSPSFNVCIPCVHPVKVCGKERGLVTARTGANLHYHASVGVAGLRKKKLLYLFNQPFLLLLSRRKLVFGQQLQFLVASIFRNDLPGLFFTVEGLLPLEVLTNQSGKCLQWQKTLHRKEEAGKVISENG